MEAASLGIAMTHGVAAKLINCYLKSRFVCGGHHAHENVAALHPPIDAIVLDTLASEDNGCHRDRWNSFRRIRWSKFTSEQYQEVITLIRESLGDKPMWMIEEHWRGNQ